LRLSASIDKEAFNSVIRGAYFTRRSHNTDTPYCLAFQLILMLVPAAQALRPDLFGAPKPVDFIFDEQGEIGLAAQGTWLEIKRNCEELAQRGGTDFRPYIGSMPDFRDEKQFLPIQAADLYAWNVRRLFFDSNPRGAQWLDVLSTIPQVSKHMAQKI
jgi:hypothetical protein